MSTLSAADIDSLIAQGEARRSLADIKPADAWTNTLLTPEAELGAVAVPWAKLHGKFDLRLGELTIWGGDSGSGKSALLGQVMAHCIWQGSKALIASFEMPPRQTLIRLLRQCSGTDKPARDWCLAWLKWASDKLWIWDHLDTIPADRVLAATGAVAEHLGIRHVVIDSLMMCGLPQDGHGYLTAQTEFIRKLSNSAKAYDIHIHLVAHTRKPERGQRTPAKHDIRGASQITDLAHNVIMLSRNKEKEKAQVALDMGMTPQNPDALDEWDTYVSVEKQRATGTEQTFGLAFDRKSGAWSEDKRNGWRWIEPWTCAH